MIYITQVLRSDSQSFIKCLAFGRNTSVLFPSSSYTVLINKTIFVYQYIEKSGPGLNKKEKLELAGKEGCSTSINSKKVLNE